MTLLPARVCHGVLPFSTLMTLLPARVYLGLQTFSSLMTAPFVQKDYLGSLAFANHQILQELAALDSTKILQLFHLLW